MPLGKTGCEPACNFDPYSVNRRRNLALARRQWFAAFGAAVGFLIIGTLTFSFAIGASNDLRTHAGATAIDMTEKRADLKQRRDAAEKALAELPNTRPANEITAEIDALMTSRKDLDPTGLGKCVDWLPSVAARDVCAKASRLKVELPAAQKREALEVELHAARDGLAQTSATKAFANGDAAAIVSLLERAGVRASVDNVNLYLSVLLVLALELGPGIAFMLAGVFAEQTRHTPAAPPKDSLKTSGSTNVVQLQNHRAKTIGTTGTPPMATGLEALLGQLKSIAVDGVVRLSQRKLAEAVGSKSRPMLGEQLKALCEQGKIEVDTNRSGTCIRLKVA